MIPFSSNKSNSIYATRHKNGMVTFCSQFRLADWQVEALKDADPEQLRRIFHEYQRDAKNVSHELYKKLREATGDFGQE